MLVLRVSGGGCFGFRDSWQCWAFKFRAAICSVSSHGGPTAALACENPYKSRELLLGYVIMTRPRKLDILLLKAPAGGCWLLP